MTKNKLYTILLVACSVGFAYLIYSIHQSYSSNFTVCMIKNITGFPCPSCGTTRAVSLIWQGKLVQSLAVNPLGIVVFILMIVAPIWILFDLLLKKETFYNFYKKTEVTLKNKWLAIFLIVLIVLNWFWNIKKGL
jgi:Protein of unknown function (DUF2752)